MDLRDTSIDHAPDTSTPSNGFAGSPPAFPAAAQIDAATLLSKMLESARPMQWPVYDGAALAILASDIEHAPDGELQFKGNTDKKGVNGHMHNVQYWDPAFAGICIVWKRTPKAKKKAKLYIADGHQRLDRAQFLSTAENPIKLNCIVLDEANGWTAEKVRLFAAYKNIAEDGPTTSAMDVARLVRQSDEPVDFNFLRRWLPTQNRALTDGLLLSKLGDEAFALMDNPAAKTRWGTHVAQRMHLDGNGRSREEAAEMQAVLLQTLLETKPQSDVEMVQIVEMAIEAGFTKVEQMTLFGKEEVRETLIPQRFQIYREVDGLVKKRLKAISTVNSDAQTRVTLKVGAQKGALMEQADILTWSGLLLKSNANKVGEVSSHLSLLARRLKGKEVSLSQAAESMLGMLQQEVPAFRAQNPGALAEDNQRRAVAKEHGAEAAAAMDVTRDMLAGVNRSNAEAEAAPSFL